MDLWEYWNILRRRWWIPVALVALVAAYSLATYHPPRTTFGISMRFTIGIQADPNVTGTDPRLPAYQASEYIRDDFVEILHSALFADDVNKRLAGTGITVTRGVISGAVEKQRRIMSMSITWPNADEAQKIAAAARQTLEQDNNKYFAQLGAQGASVAIIDGPDVFPIAPGLREQLDVPIRIGLALLAGLLLALFVDYLDDTVRTARELETLGLRVIGEIPRTRRY